MLLFQATTNTSSNTSLSMLCNTFYFTRKIETGSNISNISGEITLRNASLETAPLIAKCVTFLTRIEAHFLEVVPMCQLSVMV